MASSQELRSRRCAAQRGVTLIELMIAITLVAVLSSGLLFAMRTSLVTYQKIQQRLDSNRRDVSVREILGRQVASAMPVAGACPSTDSTGTSRPIPVPFFTGTENSVRMVSSYSVSEGARGYPQIVEYQVQRLARGGFRLVSAEHPYTGPASTAPFCRDRTFAPVELGPNAMVLADHLQYCRFSYHPTYDPFTYKDLPWMVIWNAPGLSSAVLPAAVQIDMKSAEPVFNGLPVMGITIPIEVDRNVMVRYDDRF